MSSNALSHKEHYCIRFHDLDLFGRPSVQSICNYFQEIADNQARQKGFSVGDLFQRNLTWVVSRFHIEILRYPVGKGEITIETWPSAVDGRFALRDFLLTDNDGECLISATSSWLILDLRTHRPVPIELAFPDFQVPSRPRAIEDNFESLPVPEMTDFSGLFEVRIWDLDTNMHVNNVHYMDWICGVFPLQFLRTHLLQRIEISYRAETRFPETIRSVAARSGDAWLHQLFRLSDGEEVARARTSWIRVQGSDH